MPQSEYLKLADTIAAEIADGTLKPGDRLPPQRNFAWERKIAVSTASRVYSELLRRGLVVGEVGRGTFISGEARRGAAPSEPSGNRIDLEFNYPLRPDHTALIAKSLDGLQTATALESALRPATSVGTPAIRGVAAAYLSQGAWSPSSDRLVFTGNGRQSIAAALASVVPSGGRCGVEPLTYPFIKGIAARLGISLVPLAMDEDGVRPDSVQKARREGHLSAIYIQPVVQNPLGMTMPPARRADLLRVVEKLDLPVVEDNVYGFLDPEIAPLAALAPDRCIVIDSLSKKVAPGLSLGFVVPSRRLRESVMAAVRSGGWTASGIAFAAAQRMMGDGTVAELSRLKRIDARARQKLAMERLSGFDIQTNGKCYHLWLILPPHWRSQTFVAAAARRDIALTPSTTFATTPGHAPNAVRLALAAPTMEQLDDGLRTLAAILNSREDDLDSTE